MKKILLCLGLASVLFGADNNVKFEITPPNSNIRADFSEWTISQIGKEPHPD